MKPQDCPCVITEKPVAPCGPGCFHFAGRSGVCLHCGQPGVKDYRRRAAVAEQRVKELEADCRHLAAASEDCGCEVCEFHLGDVLSITTGRLVSPRGMDAIYDILNWMTGESLFTHQLPRAMRQCLPFLTRQHPDLPAEADAPEFSDKEHVERWLAEMVAKYGETRAVAKLPPGENGPRDPIQEAVEVFGKERVVVIEAPDPEGRS